MKNLGLTSKQFLVTLGLIVAVLAANAQSNEAAYRAYINNSLGLWKQAINATDDKSFERAIAYQGYLSATMADQDEEAFDMYYDDAVDLLEELVEQDEYSAQSKALLSSLYGLSIAYDGWKGMFLGSKASGLASEAYQAAPEDPLVLRMYASNKFYTPESFGGDRKEALEVCKKSVKAYESSGDMANNHLYLDALALLGMIHSSSGNVDSAISVYERALEVEPDFGWVKFALLPSAKKTKSGS